MSLIIKKNTTFKIPRTPSFLPSSLGALSLWLKADAGVTTTTYTYKSNITLSGAGESSINGSYTAGDPGSGSANYLMNGPNSNIIQVRPNSSPIYRLYNLDNSTFGTPWFYSFTSTNGSTWTAAGKKPVSITISGFTGTSSTSNGTYNSYEWDSENDRFVSYKSIEGGLDESFAIAVYPDGYAEAYALTPTFSLVANKPTGWGIGAWTIEEGTGTPVGTGTLYPTGGVPTGAVTTTNVVTPNVTAWSDQSPVGNNFYGSATILNSSDLNSKPTITLSTTDYPDEGDPSLTSRWLSSSVNPAIMGDVGTTAFAVIFVDDVCTKLNTNGAIFGNFGTAVDGSHYPYGPECSVYDSFATENRKGPLTSPVTIANSWSLYSVTSTTNDWRAYINGLLMHSDEANVYSNVINNTDEDGNGYLQIGYQYQNGNHFLNGKVAEVVIYNRVLTTPERQQVEAYLNSKYQIY